MSNPLLTTPRERTVTLLPGDYKDRIDAASADVDEIERHASSDKRQAALAVKKAEALDAMRKPENIDGAVVVTMREVPNKRWRQMQDDAPPRVGNRRDEVYGFNEDAFTFAAIVASIIAPVVSPGEFAEFADQVSPANWRKLRDVAFDLSEREVDIPKSSAVSLLLEGRDVE